MELLFQWMEEIEVEQILKRVFDYQRFSPDKRLSAMIEEAEKRYRALADEDLSLVTAAGDMGLTYDLLEKKDGCTDKNI